MRRLICVLFFLTITAHAQQGPPAGYPEDAPWPPIPPCGDKGVPANLPCDDHGTVRNTQSPPFVPHEDWTEEQKTLLYGPAPQPQPLDRPKGEPSLLWPTEKDATVNEPITTEGAPISAYKQPTHNTYEPQGSREQGQHGSEPPHTFLQGFATGFQNGLQTSSISKRSRYGVSAYPRRSSATKQNAEISAIQREIQRLNTESAAIALDTMEIKRRIINEEKEGALQGWFQGDERFWQCETREWQKLRDSYCETTPDGTYIDLEEKPQTCGNSK